MTDGFDVRPEALRAAAAGLRGDAVDLDEAGVAVQRAIDTAAEAAGPGALTGSAVALTGYLTDVVAALRARVEDNADALDGAAAGYVTGDDAASASLSDSAPPIVIPGLGTPG